MTILWCGGEDIDFPAGAPVSVDTTSSRFSSTYARNALYNSGAGNTSSRSLPFAGGAVTSCWLHANVLANPSGVGTRAPLIGLGLNSTAFIALYVGIDTVNGLKLALYSYDGTTATKLAAETGASINGVLCPIDMQVINYGASATVNVYYNGNLVISFTGNVAVSGVTALDCVCIPGGSGFFAFTYTSEYIVADADTRAMRLLTMAPNAAGDTNNWTNGYTNINPVTINDANVIFVNTTGQDFQANLIDLPAGLFSVNAVKVAARAEVTAGATPTGLKLGVKTGGTINVDGGHSLSAGFATYERLMNTNPVTTNPWLASEMIPLQIDLQSA